MMGYAINLENANAEVMDWLDFTANARIHATTLQRPFDLLEQEQPHLLPVPKPYNGVHPTKAVDVSISQESKKSTKRKMLHIPLRDLQNYDALIPSAALVILPLLAANNIDYMGSALWR